MQSVQDASFMSFDINFNEKRQTMKANQLVELIFFPPSCTP